MPLKLISLKDIAGLSENVMHAMNIANRADLKIDMKNYESDFLLSMLNERKPKKIVEVGVSAGGTTVLILNSLAFGQILYSIDISDTYYRDRSFSTGFIVDKYCNEEVKKRHVTYYNRDVVQVIEEIGEEIDCVILDTMHTLPGELLSLCALLPFLAHNAIIILHDLCLNIAKDTSSENVLNRISTFASKVAFTSIVSRKKFILDVPLANIGCVFYDKEFFEETAYSIFQNMTLTWNYYPSTLIQKYQKFIKKFYDTNIFNFFDETQIMQKKIIELLKYK